MSSSELPIYELEDRLIAAVRTQGRLMVQPPTGSGKSAPVPAAKELSRLAS
jgi:ATP-dependent helicase HrpB